MSYSPSLGIWTPPKRGIVDVVKERLANLASLVNGGMVNGGHALVDGGAVRAHSPLASPLAAFVGAGWENGLNDVTANANNLTKITGTNATVAGPSNMGNLNSFNGSTYYSAASSASLQIASGQSGGFICWIKASAANSAVFVLDKGTLGLGGSEYFLVLQNVTPQFYTRMERGNSTNNRDIIYAAVVNDGAWHLFIFQYNQTAGFGQYSVDGTNFTNSLSLFGDEGFAGSNTLFYGDNGSGTLTITAALATYIFKGTVITNAQAAALWNSGNGVLYPWAGVP